MEKAIRKYWPVFVLPTLAAFSVGFIYPFVQGLYLSFCKFTTIKKATFIGFGNYAYAVTDGAFWHSFWFTALFTVVSTVIINVLAFSIALALTNKIKGSNFFRTENNRLLQKTPFQKPTSIWAISILTTK